jgi:SAM-dependent methyltransferase
MDLWHRTIHALTRRFRERRGQFMVQHFPALRSLRICDLGGSNHFWEKLALNVPPHHITIYNISADETQGIEGDDSGRIQVHLYDGRHIPVPDKAFDLLVCNSVLEHVPADQRAALAAEMRRVAKSVFCQTPAKSFPLEPHFLLPFVHWLPRKLGFWLIHVSPWRLLSRPSEETIHEYWWGTRLLDRREIEALFPEDSVVAERVLGFTKSYYVVRHHSETMSAPGNSCLS